MTEKTSEILITEILKRIPDNIKPVDYLMEILALSRDTVYRRLNGSSSFTFEDIEKLSLELNFSIDDIIDRKKHDRVSFDMIGDMETSTDEIILAMLNELYRHFSIHMKAKEARVIISMNRLFIVLVLMYDNLFKFLCYKWAYETHKIPIDFSFSEMKISGEVKALCNKLKEMYKGIGNFVTIIDTHTIFNDIKYIQYYYKRDLISKEELASIQEELFMLVDTIELLMRTRVTDEGNKFDFYLSSLNIESNTAYAVYDGVAETNFWIYPVSPLRTTDKKTCAMHDQWLKSLKKYSTLITQSNELKMTQFMKAQREYISNIDKFMY